MADRDLQFTYREMLTFLRSPRLLLTFIVIVFLFTITGPFGTDDSLPPAVRFFYWLTLHAVAWSTAIIFSISAGQLLKPNIRNPLVRMMIGSLIAAVPIGLWISLIDLGFRRQPLTLSGIASDIVITIPLSLLFCVLTYLTTQLEMANAAINTNQNSPSLPPILRRMKMENRSAIMLVSAEDHYTRITTNKGSELVLLRFSDALNELGDTAGIQIHRSHWIADAYVKQLQKTGGSLVVATRDGTTLPISRSAQKIVRDRYGSASLTIKKA